jgi:hypothetical protein
MNPVENAAPDWNVTVTLPEATALSPSRGVVTTMERDRRTSLAGYGVRDHLRGLPKMN